MNSKLPPIMPNHAIRCVHPVKLDDPQKAGSITWDALAEKATLYPHLKPCPKYKFHWIAREQCKHCTKGIPNE